VIAPDQDTRERLLGEAARLFAARGFARVTVRDICRAANANVAAINYHFHGKRGGRRQPSSPRDKASRRSSG